MINSKKSKIKILNLKSKKQIEENFFKLERQLFTSSKMKLVNKYDSQNERFTNIITNNIIKGKKVKISAVYREMEKESNPSEFLTVFYSKVFSFVNLPFIIKFHINHFKIFPIYYILNKISCFIYKNLEQKQRIINENLEILEKDVGKKIFDKIFTTEVLNSFSNDENYNNNLIEADLENSDLIFLTLKKNQEKMENSLASIENLVCKIEKIEENLENTKVRKSIKKKNNFTRLPEVKIIK
jgi:hypothetical protein